jgi:hypothetical protein
MNHPSREEEEAIGELGKKAEVVAMVVGRETGQTGTPHLQEYVEFITGVSRTALEGPWEDGPGSRRPMTPDDRTWRTARSKETFS